MIWLGIDGGGTKTRALLADATGKVLGLGRSGSSNLNLFACDEVAISLREATTAAFSAAGLSPQPVVAAYLGVAGLKDEQDAVRYRGVMCQAGLADPNSCHAANDLENALAGGLSGRVGIALIAGTGSHCLGRDAQGRTVTCGGWGWLMDEVGSGYFLGKRGLQTLVRAEDGRGEPTLLRDRILNHLGVATAGALLHRIYSTRMGPTEIASLAPLVVAAASEGDAVAGQILAEGADGLAVLVQKVAEALFSGNKVEVVLVGGVALSGPPYQTALTERIERRVPGAIVKVPELSPEAGAILNARRASGHPNTPEVIECLRASLASLAQ
jgi:glucosamine kinase